MCYAESNPPRGRLWVSLEGQSTGRDERLRLSLPRPPPATREKRLTFGGNARSDFLSTDSGERTKVRGPSVSTVVNLVAPDVRSGFSSSTSSPRWLPLLLSGSWVASTPFWRALG